MAPLSENDDDLQNLLRAARLHSTATVLLHRAIAESIGLSTTDHKYLDVLVHEGPMPAGRLAEITGLTSGAVTGVIDRLEEAGLVRREKDPSDRRKVIIQPMLEEGSRAVGPAFQALVSRANDLYGGFDRRERAIILEYLNRGTAMMRDAARELKKNKEQDEN